MCCPWFILLTCVYVQVQQKCVPAPGSGLCTFLEDKGRARQLQLLLLQHMQQVPGNNHIQHKQEPVEEHGRTHIMSHDMRGCHCHCQPSPPVPRPRDHQGHRGQSGCLLRHLHAERRWPTGRLDVMASAVSLNTRHSRLECSPTLVDFRGHWIGIYSIIFHT